MSATTHPRTSPAATGLPAYLLYGEAGSPFEAERLHIETITARSALHDWEIRPHRHDGLFQILYMASGQAEAWLDGASHPLVGPCALQVPALVAHGFRFQPGVQGHVLTVQEAHVAALLDGLLPAYPAARAAWQSPQLLMLPRGEGAGVAADLGQAVERLADEHAAQRPFRAAALDVALRSVLLALARSHAAEPTAAGAQPAGGRAVAHLARYRALVEARFRQQPRMAELAAELGITSTQLNRICQAVLGQSALDVLHARLALEAQRQLAYTGLSVKRIGLELGFADAGYFNRFFLRLCGQTPGQWRASRVGIERPGGDNASVSDPISESVPMIYKFKSQAAGDVIMLGPQGDRVLGLLGKEPARQGIIEPAAMPAAIAALEAAIAADEALRAELRRAREADAPDASRRAEGLDAITLRQRAWPLIEMMQRCHRAEAPIVWGV